ncbi:hypothetical protein DJ50_4577 [Bacillus cereus ATCC 10876]|nr:hypothetical protein DJ50_4577 [Bacillus cereus ATCC 10876]
MIFSYKLSVLGVWLQHHQTNKTELPSNGSMLVLYCKFNFILSYLSLEVQLNFSCWRRIYLLN